MKEIDVIAPIKKPEDIEAFVPHVKCRDFYVYHQKFLNNNFEYINEFIETAHKNNCRIYLNFKHNITEEDLKEIKKFIRYLKTTKIDGIFINSFAIIEGIKCFKLPFKVIADSYFDIHNLQGIDFLNNFHKIDQIIITEEIYMKNIAKIKKYTNISLAIDSDNLPWCAEDIESLGAIDNVVIKGKFETSEDILEGIELVEKILEKPKMFKSQKLPFKHVRKSIYQTNHFSGEMISADGKDFKFRRNILHHEWSVTRSRIKPEILERIKNDDMPLPRLNLRLSRLEHIDRLKRYLKRLRYNPIHSIEYGELLSTKDLSTSSYSEIIDKVKKFCKMSGVKFHLSTPKILIERDFDRVFEYSKSLILLEPKPDLLIINNIGYFWAVVNDPDLADIPIEIGQGINLLNSMSINCLNQLHNIESVDFTSFEKSENIFRTLKALKNNIPNRKLTIAGNKKIPSLGLCPLNNDSAIISRLRCPAHCHTGSFALRDPSLKKVIPFTCDGFCRMHMFEDEVLQDFDNIQEYLDAGINEFVFDFSNLSASYISVLLTNFLNKYAK